MKKLLLFTVLVLVAAASAAYGLTLLDKIVHGTLYNFGLQFSYDWANPYWTMLRVVLALIGLAAVFNVVNSVYVYRKYIHAKPQVTLSKSEKKVISPSVREPEPPSESQRVGGLVKCTHCNRVFAQPLRMLDFHSDRPRIISICPFCNEVIPPILRHEEVERGKKAVQKGRKDDDHERVMRELQEARQGQRKEDAREAKDTEATVAASG